MNHGKEHGKVTFKVKHFSGSYYTVKYRFRWYHIFYRTVREWRTTWTDPVLNTMSVYLGMNPMILHYADAIAFVADHTEQTLRAWFVADRAAYEVKQAEIRKTWKESKQKNFKVTK